MIDQLKALAVFAKVVEAGSFRGAAKQLNLAPSAVSHHVASLEGSLGVTLLYRTTRSLSLTDDGKKLFNDAREMLMSAERGLNLVAAASREPAGALRITVPAYLPYSTLSKGISAFTVRYPGIALTICYSDMRINLIDEGFDLAIRVGSLNDSSMKSLKIGTLDRRLVASGDYFRRYPIPNHPTDLESWRWISFEARSDTTEFSGPDGEKAIVIGDSQVSVDNVMAMHSFAIDGLGLAILPEHFVESDFRCGRLVHVLPDWRVASRDIHAVWPNNARRESLTTLLVGFLADYTRALAYD